MNVTDDRMNASVDQMNAMGDQMNATLASTVSPSRVG
jgi:hypothetical protein